MSKDTWKEDNYAVVREVLHPQLVSQLNTYFKSSHFLNVFEMTPEKNDLLIFPSYLVHSVSPNISDLTRVSVAFDIGFIDV